MMITKAQKKSIHDELKEILTYYNKYDLDEIVEHFKSDDNDFEVGRYRYIDSDVIDDILAKELSDEPGLLGSFEDWIISEALPGNVDTEIIAKLKVAGDWVLGEFLNEIPEFTKNIADLYVKYDGYGHHFNLYDGSEEIIALPNKREYYIFRIN